MQLAMMQNFGDFVPGLVDGFLRASTPSNTQLLDDPAIANAAQQLRLTMTEMINYNLVAIQNIAQIVAKCASQPALESRRIIEMGRETAFACLQSLRSNAQNDRGYITCLAASISQAKRNIDSLRPTIDACVAMVPPSSTNPRVSV